MDELVDRTHDGGPELLKIVEFADAFVAFGVVTVDCVVNDAVKIEVQVVYLCKQILKLTDWRDVFKLAHILQNHRVASCQPPEKFRNAHFNNDY